MKKAKRLNSGKQYLSKIVQHPLATQELLGVLKSIGSAQTESETKTLARLAAAYRAMGKQFPSRELEADLTPLYSSSLGVANAMQRALAALVTKHPSLTLEAIGLTIRTLTAATQEKFATEWSKVFQQVDIDCTPVLEHCRELLFLTLEAATKRIRAALKQGAQD